ncbi:MAG: hypothetical protein ABSD03_01750 [Vulcanimicrobiaceae bacterium]
MAASLIAVATTATLPAGATTKPPLHRHLAKASCKVAPADEYFGKLKMSILGIRNTIKDQGLKIDVDPARAPGTMGAIALTEDAIHDWQRKYPCDSWLPTTIFALEHFYAKIHTDDGVRRVHATYAWLRHAYPHAHVVDDAQREDAGATAISDPAGAQALGAQAVAAPASSPQPRR